MPFVFKNSNLALKGGTAINLFYNDMPRLSVDIDGVLINPSFDRKGDLTRINNNLFNTSEFLEKLGMTVELKTQKKSLLVQLMLLIIPLM